MHQDPQPEKFGSVIEFLQGELSEMRAETDRGQLSDLTPDEAFEHGYNAAICDARRYYNTQENK